MCAQPADEQQRRIDSLKHHYEAREEFWRGEGSGVLARLDRVIAKQDEAIKTLAADQKETNKQARAARSQKPKVERLFPKNINVTNNLKPMYEEWEAHQARTKQPLHGINMQDQSAGTKRNFQALDRALREGRLSRAKSILKRMNPDRIGFFGIDFIFNGLFKSKAQKDRERALHQALQGKVDALTDTMKKREELKKSIPKVEADTAKIIHALASNPAVLQGLDPNTTSHTAKFIREMAARHYGIKEIQRELRDQEGEFVSLSEAKNIALGALGRNEQQAVILENDIVDAKAKLEFARTLRTNCEAVRRREEKMGRSLHGTPSNSTLDSIDAYINTHEAKTNRINRLVEGLENGKPLPEDDISVDALIYGEARSLFERTFRGASKKPDRSVAASFNDAHDGIGDGPQCVQQFNTYIGGILQNLGLLTKEQDAESGKKQAFMMAVRQALYDGKVDLKTLKSEGFSVRSGKVNFVSIATWPDEKVERLRRVANISDDDVAAQQARVDARKGVNDRNERHPVPMIGEVQDALYGISSARHAGVAAQQAIRAAATFLQPNLNQDDFDKKGEFNFSNPNDPDGVTKNTALHKEISIAKKDGIALDNSYPAQIDEAFARAEKMFREARQHTAAAKLRKAKELVDTHLASHRPGAAPAPGGPAPA